VDAFNGSERRSLWSVASGPLPPWWTFVTVSYHTLPICLISPCIDHHHRSRYGIRISTYITRSSSLLVSRRMEHSTECRTDGAFSGHGLLTILPISNYSNLPLSPSISDLMHIASLLLLESQYQPSDVQP